MTASGQVKDIFQAKTIGRKIIEQLGGEYEFNDWMTMNATIFHALSLERLVTFITIRLIVLVAALNIVATLIMMVLENSHDIAILMSMGTRMEQVHRIFIFQGVIIGIIGVVG